MFADKDHLVWAWAFAARKKKKQPLDVSRWLRHFQSIDLLTKKAFPHFSTIFLYETFSKQFPFLFTVIHYFA